VLRLAIEPDERAHGDDVPGVVLDDAKEPPRIARSQEMQIESADVGRSHVVRALEAQDTALERGQPTPVPEARPVHAPGNVQEVEVRGLFHRGQTRHHQPCPKKRHVEAFSVERNEKRSSLHALPHVFEHGCFFAQLPNE
jgi:hypothetical protein